MILALLIAAHVVGGLIFIKLVNVFSTDKILLSNSESNQNVEFIGIIFFWPFFLVLSALVGACMLIEWLLKLIFLNRFVLNFMNWILR